MTREDMARKQHEIWSVWMKWMFEQGTFVGPMGSGSSWIMPKEKVTRWQRQMNTSYNELTEAEKDGDRMVVDEFGLLED